MTISQLTPRIYPVGDAALGVAFGDKISPKSNARVLALADALTRQPMAGLGEIIPAYTSLLVRYDARTLDWPTLAEHVHNLITSLPDAPVVTGRSVVIPVVYGGEYGPDLTDLAARHGISEQEVIALHAGRSYQVYMLGFTPGFPYLGEVDEHIATPRLATPRSTVPAGSVGIAGNQTGVYPIESPGGWQIIGRTNLRLFDPQSNPPTLLSAGDVVTFQPVNSIEAAE